MTFVKKALSLQGLFVLVAIVYLSSQASAWRANAIAERDRSQNFPILVSPSLQPAQGQAVVVKITNVSGSRARVRLSLFSDAESQQAPVDMIEFPDLKAKATVTHLYTPPRGALVVNGTSFEAPAGVRVLIQPAQSLDDPEAIRKVVASVHLVTLKGAVPNGPPASVESSSIVPLERCLYKSRGMVPYDPGFRGERYVWDCAPTL